MRRSDSEDNRIQGDRLKYLDRLEEILISFLMGAATLLIFVAVIHRYAAGWPIPVVQDALLRVDLSWAQELCIYMFVWMAKFGAAYGVRTGIHVGVDVLINRLPGATRKAYVLFGLLAVNYLLPIGRVGLHSRAAESAFYGLLVFSPVFCAGLLFSSSTPAKKNTVWK